MENEKEPTNEKLKPKHTCEAPMFTGILPGCKRCEEIADKFGFVPYSWHTMRVANAQIQKEIQNDR